MLHIDVICIGKIKEIFFQEAVQEYSKRLSKYCILNIIELADEKIPLSLNITNENLIKQKESNKIISHIKKGSYVICLDLTGKELSSEELAKNISSISLSSISNITFVIGGSLGMSKELLNSANQKICFSKLSFPHQMIRVFLLEQLFRGFKIAGNETYHW